MKIAHKYCRPLFGYLEKIVRSYNIVLLIPFAIVFDVLLLKFQPDQIGLLARAAAPTENDIGSLTVQNDGQAAIKQILIERIQRGWETFNLALISDVLSEDFEFWYVVNQDLVFKQPRNEYLQKRREWTTETNAPQREMVFSNPIFFETTSNLPKNMINVAAVITYRSQYFNPRFLTLYSFEQRDSTWLLAKEVAMALHPKRPEDHKVQILVGEPRSDRPEHLEVHEIMSSFGHDEVVNSYLAKVSEDRFKADDSRKTVLVLFREPPRNGAEIRVEATYRWGNKYRFFKRKWTATGGDPWFYIVWGSRCRSPCRVAYKVYAEDTLVHEQTILGR